MPPLFRHGLKLFTFDACRVMQTACRFTSCPLHTSRYFSLMLIRCRHAYFSIFADAEAAMP